MIRERLETLIGDHGLKHWSFAARKDAAFMIAVENATQHLPSDTSFPARVYAAAYGGETCSRGNLRKLISVTKGWSLCGRAAVCECAREQVSRTTKSTLSNKTDAEWAERTSKTTATLLDKYGIDNIGKLPQAKENHAAFYADEDSVRTAVERGRQTMLDRYGVDNALKLPTVDRTHRRDHISLDSLAILDDPEKLSQMAERMSSPRLAEHLGVDTSTVNNYLRRYEINHSGSSYEREIATFLDSLGVSYTPRNRSMIGLELDFLVSDRKLAIEFNGLYYHTTRTVSMDYHRTKYELCRDKGIRLLMINEDEMIERPDVVYSRIRNVLGMSERGPGARALRIEQIPNGQALTFAEKYHIQGRPSVCQVSLGAFLGDELVAVLTVSRQRGTLSNEITRFCTDGRTYAGVFSRLLKAAREIVPGKLITFADLRYSEGHLYENTGFVRVSESRPDYRYVYRAKTFHKSLFTKKKIEKQFGLDMSMMTEREAMESLGYERIYDCGKIKYQIE